MFSFNEIDLGINVRQTAREHAELIKTLGAHFASRGLATKLALGDMHFSYARLLAFGAAALGMAVVYVFMKKTYVGTAIRAIAQDRQIMVLMGVDTRRAISACERMLSI